jgi:hypothetical protein
MLSMTSGSLQVNTARQQQHSRSNIMQDAHAKGPDCDNKLLSKKLSEGKLCHSGCMLWLSYTGGR